MLSIKLRKMNSGMIKHQNHDYFSAAETSSLDSKRPFIVSSDGFDHPLEHRSHNGSPK
jgi:hypothetical protein